MPNEVPTPSSPYNATTFMVGFGAWVVHLGFGTTSHANENLVDRFEIGVNLSWPLAKALHALLGEVIAQYERAEGEVALPRSLSTRTVLASPPSNPKA